jgi:hypothetical protein
MVETPEVLAQLVAPWARFYSHSAAAATVVTFVHIAALLVGGGLALALDRDTLHQRPLPLGAGDPHAGERRAATQRARRRHLQHLAGAHRVVLTSLVIASASGVAMLAADLDTFLSSTAFWIKMGLLVLLLGNGARMNSLGTTLERGAGDVEGGWARLRTSAVVSIALWLAVTFAGVALTSAA